MRKCVPGKTYFDGCNTCRCHANNVISCILIECEMYNPYTNSMIPAANIPPPADFWQT